MEGASCAEPSPTCPRTVPVLSTAISAAELHVNAITRNYVGTAFGGSMSAMTDPYFFMLVMHQLRRDYVVWDTRGEIEFLTPGRGVLTAHFHVPREAAESIRARARGGAKVLEWFETEITDADGAHVVTASSVLLIGGEVS